MKRKLLSIFLAASMVMALTACGGKKEEAAAPAEKTEEAAPAEKEEAPGRKLGFIAQEIGREINTMGSKANDHDIQKLVVQMKDELEKIKEQSLNVL